MEITVKYYIDEGLIISCIIYMLGTKKKVSKASVTRELKTNVEGEGQRFIIEPYFGEERVEETPELVRKAFELANKLFGAYNYDFDDYFNRTYPEYL